MTQSGFEYYFCPECGFDIVVNAGSFSGLNKPMCGMCAEKYREVLMFGRPATDADGPIGFDARVAICESRGLLMADAPDMRKALTGSTGLLILLVDVLGRLGRGDQAEILLDQIKINRAVIAKADAAQPKAED